MRNWRYLQGQPERLRGAVCHRATGRVFPPSSTARGLTGRSQTLRRPGAPPRFWARVVSCCVTRSRGAMVVALLLSAGAAWAQSAAQPYVPCLGCAEHTELHNRWRRPWELLLLTHGLLLTEHFWLEQRASRMGLCEQEPLLRGRILSQNGCYHYSAARAWGVELPLELLVFVSPSWGLASHGHPRLGATWELVPIALHAIAIERTARAIDQQNKLQALLF